MLIYPFSGCRTHSIPPGKRGLNLEAYLAYETASVDRQMYKSARAARQRSLTMWYQFAAQRSMEYFIDLRGPRTKHYRVHTTSSALSNCASTWMTKSVYACISSLDIEGRNRECSNKLPFIIITTVYVIRLYRWLTVRWNQKVGCILSWNHSLSTSPPYSVRVIGYCIAFQVRLQTAELAAPKCKGSWGKVWKKSSSKRVFPYPFVTV